MKHPIFKLFLFLIMAMIAVVNFTPVTACERLVTTDYATVKAEMNTIIEAQMKKYEVTGLSIALVDDQHVVWAQGFGKANLQPETDVTPDTLFRIGSISKLFTATAIMRLVEAGKINLDQPLQTYIPEFSIKSRFHHPGLITIRSILTHHSGLPEQLERGFSSVNPEYFTSILTDLKNEYVAYQPNYIYAYSNLGFSLLGIVIERVTGQKFNDYMESEILKPLGMNRSSFILREDMKPYFSQSYSKGSSFQEQLYRDLPAGTMYSSVNQMCNFLKMVFAEGRFQQRNLLEKETLAKMLTPQNHGVPLDFNFRIGLAWHLSDTTGKLKHAGKVAKHGGDTTYYHSSLMTLPEHQLGVIVLTNTDTGGSIASDIAADTLRLALETKTGHKLPESQPRYLPVQNMSLAELKQIEGYYATSVGLMKIYSKDATWYLRFQGIESQIVCHEGHWFSAPDLFGSDIYFQIRQIGGISALIYKTTTNELITVLGEAVSGKPLPKVWQNRCGKYRYVNDPSETNLVELSIEDNLLLGDGVVVLTPISDNLAIISGLGRGAHEMIQFQQINGKEILLSSGYRLEKVEKSNELRSFSNTNSRTVAQPLQSRPAEKLRINRSL
ncbi:MAG TPA: serine hydrolase domain-containing protein [Bacillota bacterium]|nr:serine hydrolase domain-containing protein [Bacillota bacterium]